MDENSTTIRRRRATTRLHDRRALVALVTILAVGLAACGGGAADADLDGLEQQRPVTVDGAALSMHVAGVADVTEGTPAPRISGASFDGSPVEIGPGEPTIVVFLAHWCPHCRNEVPEIVEWAGRGGVPDGIEFIGVASSTTRERPNYPPSAWLEREGFPFPVLADSEAGDAAIAFGLSGYPYFVALDADGDVVRRDSGEIGAAGLDALVDALVRS